MKKELTTEECKSVLFKIGIKLGVSPKLISTRLLSQDDKKDMLQGLLPIDILTIAVQAWMKNKMPDYANGKFEPYKEKTNLPMQRYRGMGKVSTGGKFGG